MVKYTNWKVASRAQLMSRNSLLPLTVVTLCTLLLVCQSGQAQTTRSINRTIIKLRKLDVKLEKPVAGQWLASHREPGQIYTQYFKSRPNVLTRQRSVLYTQPIGKLTDAEKKIVEATNEYLSVYFGCPVKPLPSIDLSEIPESARRTIAPGHEQLLTSYILQEVLVPKVPDDAFAILALTNRDLWPGEGWNFVFGYASLRDRVGVWSLHRFGDPAKNEEAFKKCLFRTIKLATHETGHMFSIQHCTNARCNMQGSNSLAESDTQPLHLCSQCQAKILFATKNSPKTRFAELKNLCEKHGFAAEAEHYRKALELLKK